MNVSATGLNPIVPIEASLVQAKDLERDFAVHVPFLRRLMPGFEQPVIRAVRGVTLAIPKGRTYALVGESGSGKSTLARMIVGLTPPSKGEVFIGGHNIWDPVSADEQRKLRRRIQMIFQDPLASLNPLWRVSAIVSEPMRVFGLMPDGGARAARVAELLELVGLSTTDGRKFPHEFSGGQRQRIAIARALASDPEFIVCDEPTSALDVSVQAQVLNLLKRLQKDLSLTYLFISHDLAVVRHMADRIGVLYLGELVEERDSVAFFETPEHPYSQMLLSAVPNATANSPSKGEPVGEIPDAASPPPGCAFHPRCPVAREICSRLHPKASQVPTGHASCHLL